MGTPKKNIALSKAHISFKRSTLTWMRFVLNCVETATGTERMFYIEMETINPTLSPNNIVLGYKLRANIKSDDLQYALAGTEAAREVGTEAMPPPSYVAVRAGTLGVGAKQLVTYAPPSQLAADDEKWSVAGCTFMGDALTGHITLAATDVAMHPEYMCDAGSIAWDLKFDCEIPFPALYKKSTDSWTPLGAKTQFVGKIVLDGREYTATIDKSCGYVDFSDVKKAVLPHALPVPYFHISSNLLTSLISGRTMMDSCLALHGLYGNDADSVALALKLGDKTIVVPQSNRGVHTIQECVEATEDEYGQRLHWSVSVDLKGTIPYGKYVIDIDVMCHTKLLSMRNIELPEGGRHMLHLLAGGDGVGTVKLFQHVKKDLVLIEEAHIAQALCEFGEEGDSVS